MREGAKSVPEAAYFLGSGCEPLRSGLGITGLLLPQVLASHMVNALGSGSPAIDLGNEIIWDDHDADDRKLSAAAFMNHMSVMKVCVCVGKGEGGGLMRCGRRLDAAQPSSVKHLLRVCVLADGQQQCRADVKGGTGRPCSSLGAHSCNCNPTAGACCLCSHSPLPTGACGAAGAAPAWPGCAVALCVSQR